MLIYSTITNCWTGKPLIDTFKAFCPIPFVYYINLLVQTDVASTTNDNVFTSSPPSTAGSQGIWGLLLQIRQPSWTLSQVVMACGRHKTSDVIPLSSCENLYRTHGLIPDLEITCGYIWAFIVESIFQKPLPPPPIFLLVSLSIKDSWAILPKIISPSVRYATNLAEEK